MMNTGTKYYASYFTVVEAHDIFDALQQIRRIEGYRGQMVEDLAQVSIHDYIKHLRKELYEKNKKIDELEETNRRMRVRHGSDNATLYKN